jgi:rSAM/selenodomain-associated transferase 1
MQILVMAKSPIAGQVKTRLCPPCTPEEAASLAEAALCDTLDAARATGMPVVLALAGPPTRALPTRRLELIEQRGASFNERLEHAWGSLRSGGVQIGMDTPQVTATALHHAIVQLDAAPAVLGEATDGGWWCLGLRAAVPGAFDGVAMSTATTGAQQRNRLAELGVAPTALPELTDVDTWDDACAVAASAPRTRFAAEVAIVSARLPVGRPSA